MEEEEIILLLKKFGFIDILSFQILKKKTENEESSLKDHLQGVSKINAKSHLSL